jgi:prepilin-type N-terminal cleavage/methylation domain-containing protein
LDGIPQQNPAIGERGAGAWSGVAPSAPSAQRSCPLARPIRSTPRYCCRASSIAPFRSGFTFTELLVATLIISVLGAIILTVVGRVRASAASVSCLANLRTIGEGFRLFAVDHAGRLPDPSEQDTSWEEMISRYVGETQAFRCPSDNEVFPSIGSSYDWRDAGGPETSMAGRTITEIRGDAILAFETLPGWHAAKRINAVSADGSARQLAEDECLADMFKSVRSNGE